MNAVTDHRSLVDALGGNKAVAEGLTDCTAVRVGQWKLGNRIPVEYWEGVIVMAETAKIPEIDSDWLMRTTPPRAKAA